MLEFDFQNKWKSDWFKKFTIQRQPSNKWCLLLIAYIQNRLLMPGHRLKEEKTSVTKTASLKSTVWHLKIGGLTIVVRQNRYKIGDPSVKSGQGLYNIY